jgi:hypothetical protein
MKTITKAAGVLATLVCLYLFMSTVMAQTDTVHTARRAIYTVQYGDTLYTIAQRFDPHDDPRVVVWTIQHENGIGAEIHPGQQIVVPDGR